tara:strand:- start:12899 stop:14284 length:1386 start_codon:yes stop_codon:yes gene_type:complete
LFWKNKDILMRTSEDDAPGLVAKLLKHETENATSTTATSIKPATSLYISSSQNLDPAGFDVVISCTPEALPSTTLKVAKVKHYLHLKCQSGKLGSRDLRSELLRLSAFLSSLSPAPASKILVCCPTAKDLSVGTALAILCLYANDSGALDFSAQRDSTRMDKNLIKQRLSWITTSNPALNPSRATLQSVNAVLLSRQDPKPPTPAPRPKPTTTESKPKSPTTTESTPASPTAQRSHASTQPSLPRAIWTTLQTTPWSFHRSLTSTLPTHPNGTVSGTATFSPCALPSPFPATLLYAEEGEFVTASGLRFGARRKYVYQLRPPADSGDGAETEGEAIVVKFFDDEKLPRARVEDGVGRRGEGVGGVFVEMGRLIAASENAASEGGGVVYEARNRAQHLCAEDLYTASWRFGGGMVRGEGEGVGEGMWWEVRYDVKGPKKDYVSVTRYEKAEGGVGERRMDSG